MQSKFEIRALMRSLAAGFPPEDAARESASIWSQVEALPQFAAASTILIYMSLPGEVPTRDFIAFWRGCKRFVLPRVCGKSLELCEYSPERLVSGYRGIEEPSSEAPLVVPADVDLALVPGMAFARTPSGAVRLGHGGGFYDRLLPLLHCPRIGLCFSFRLLDSIPTDSLDCPLDLVVTSL